MFTQTADACSAPTRASAHRREASRRWQRGRVGEECVAQLPPARVSHRKARVGQRGRARPQLRRLRVARVAQHHRAAVRGEQLRAAATTRRQYAERSASHRHVRVLLCAALHWLEQIDAHLPGEQIETRRGQTAGGERRIKEAARRRYQAC
eukprot:5699056-Pleurochrysis_carterae.AAC.2